MQPATEQLPAISTEEAELWRQARADESAVARDRLFSTYALFARQIAARHYRKYRGGDIDHHDLRQLAYAGLLEAIDRFDPSRGIPFRAYAGRRVTGSILDGIAKMSERREQQTVFRTRMRTERVRSLAAERSEDSSGVDALEAFGDLVAGLAIGFMLDSGFAAANDQADERPDAYESLAWKETVRKLRSEIEGLPERERRVLHNHYFLGMGFDQIAALLGVSKGRISQLHRVAVTSLRIRMATPDNFAVAL